MKALILAGGRGKRLEGISQSINKCMLNLGGKPIIEYNIDNAVESGIDEIIIVVGYKAEDIINRYGIRYQNIPIRYVIQKELKGLVNAIESASSSIGKDDFLLMLGDEILVRNRIKSMIQLFNQGNFGVCGVLFQKDKSLVSNTYSIVEDSDHVIYRLIEKPRNPLNNIMGTGHCVFSNKILSYIEKTPTNHERGEKELPDLIQCSIDDGNIVKSFIVCDDYYNINSEKDLKQVERFLSN